MTQYHPEHQEMPQLTTFQRFELVIIPLSFSFSELVMLSLASMFLGKEALSLVGIPFLVGVTLSLPIVVVLNRGQWLDSFQRLETLLRFLVMLGGAALVPVLLSQLVISFSGYEVFFFLALIFSALGATITLSCLLVLWRGLVIEPISG
ncbi:MAG: hypothetical protein ACFFE8_14830 [Candidatus Heimdallarchaeota archaeon]